MRRGSLGIVLLLAACLPQLPIEDGLVTAPRVVAVRSEPAEAKPGSTVRWTALVVAPRGEASPEPRWSLCTDRKAPSEPGAVSRECLAEGVEASRPLGDGAHVSGTVPPEACRLFGPDPPMAKPGEPAGRPVDPDATGGYYQPLVLRLDGTTVLGATRLTCGVAGATQEQSAEFVSRTRPNANPEPSELALDDVVLPASGDGEPMAVKAGTRHRLRVSWPACGAAPEPCAGAEPYLVFDARSRTIEERTESMHVAWYVTGGALASTRGGVAEAAAAAASLDNDWTAPFEAVNVDLWVVLLDDRGGTGWRRYTLAVVD